MESENEALAEASEVGDTPSAPALRSLLQDLEGALVRMDEQGLSLAANHVSQGIELIRDEVNSIQNGCS